MPLLRDIYQDYKRNYNYSFIHYILYDIFYPNFKFRFLVWLRICEFLKSKKILILYPFAKFFYHRYSVKGNIEIAFFSIKSGVKIIHSSGSIIINSNAIIGHNSQLSPGVIVGISSIKRKDEVPIIGDNVYLAPNSKVYGKSIIGDNVIIGTDTIVRDANIPSNCNVIGNPNRIIMRDSI